MREERPGEPIGSSSSDTMADRVYAVLRHEITHGILRSGSPLIEDELAERLGVSRSPVRDCMQRLAVDGLIVSRRRRWIVKDHTLEEIVQVYEVRAALDSYAARLAARVATAQERADILALGERFEVEPRNRVTTNDRFHDAIVRAAHNERLAAVVDRNAILHFDTALAGLYTPSDLELSARQHLELARAILDNDAEVACRIAREHVEFSLRLLIEKSRRPPAAPALNIVG